MNLKKQIIQSVRAARPGKRGKYYGLKITLLSTSIENRGGTAGLSLYLFGIVPFELPIK
jgi:hypothetical protein